MELLLQDKVPPHGSTPSSGSVYDERVSGQGGRDAVAGGAGEQAEVASASSFNLEAMGFAKERVTAALQQVGDHQPVDQQAAMELLLAGVC
jgi:hypothetical protein